MQSEELSCKLVQDKLFDLVTDLLDEEERSAVLLHIKSCPSCAQEYATIQAILSAASDIEEVEPPVGLQDAVFDRIKSETAKRPIKFSQYFKRAAEIVVPIAACAALAIGIYQSGLYDELINSDDKISSGITTETTTTRNENQEIDVETDSTPVIEESAEKGEEKAPEITPEPSNTTVVPAKTDTTVSVQPEPEQKVTESETSNTVNEPVDITAAYSAEKTITDKSTEVDSDDATATDSTEDTGEPVLYGIQRALLYDSEEETASEPGAMSDEAVPEAADNYGVVSGGGSGGGSSARVVIPASCTVITDNPSDFAAMFGAFADETADSITFTINSSDYETLKNTASGQGATVTDAHGESDGTITVTVIKR